MTITQSPTDRLIDRWSGGCFVATGLLLLPIALHPNIFESTFAHAALHTDLWVPMHAAGVVGMGLSLVGLFGIYARHGRELGRLGAVAFGVSVTGLVVAACTLYWEAFLLPPIARQNPELFDWDGPVVTDWGVRSGGLSALWMVGFALLGLALWRARVVPRAAALTLALSALAFTVFAGPFVPVLGPLSVLAFGFGYAWVGVALWTGATEPVTQRVSRGA